MRYDIAKGGIHLKKLLLFSALAVVLILVAVAVVIWAQFGSLSSEDASADRLQIEAYAAEKYPEYECVYDKKSETLTLTKTTEFSIASAQAIYGENETYPSMVKIIAADVLVACDLENLTVTLRYLSKDGEPMYEVSSDGTAIVFSPEGG